MDLSLITRGRVESPPRLLVYSPPKIGKSAFAAGIPGVVFVAAEQGTQEFDVARVPPIRKCEGVGPKHSCGWADVRGWLQTFASAKHDYRALAIDTLDWLEAVLFSHLVATDPKGRGSIVEAHGGYGKAYDLAVEEWRRVASILDACNARGMAIVLLAHSTIAKHHDPLIEEIDAHRLKMHKSGAGFWSEWADAILFAGFELVRAVGSDAVTSTGRRVLHTTPHAQFAYLAGNRYGLPPVLDLSWPALDQALRESSPSKLAAELDALLSSAPDPLPWAGSTKTHSEIRSGLSRAVDRRTMRAIVEAVRNATATENTRG